MKIPDKMPTFVVAIPDNILQINNYHIANAKNSHQCIDGIAAGYGHKYVCPANVECTNSRSGSREASA